jgi:hypothetical protein
MAAWESATTDRGQHVHVLPLADVIAHDENDDCVCGTTTEPVTREDGTIGWVVTHHSLDGREADE